MRKYTGGQHSVFVFYLIEYIVTTGLWKFKGNDISRPEHFV